MTISQIKRIDFRRVANGDFYSDKNCAECNNPAEFEYAIWYASEVDSGPDETGALCGACSAVILLQESSNEHVTLEKVGLEVRAIR